MIPRPARCPWKACIRDLSRLERLSALAAGPARNALVERVEARLVSLVSSLPHDGQIATALELALRCASRPLLEAIPEVGTSDLARLSDEEWRRAAGRLDSDLLSLAYAKGLCLDEARDPLIQAAKDNTALEAFVLGPLSRDRFWYPVERDATLLWMTLTNIPLAARFLRAQVHHHTEQAQRQFRRVHMGACELDALIWQLAGAARPEDLKRFSDPLQKIADAQPSNHARLKVLERYRDLEHLLAFHQGRGA